MGRFTVIAIAGALLSVSGLTAQEAAKATSQEANIKSYINLLRQDIKKDKVSILTELMELTPDQAAKFWPVYNEYDKELTRLGDERIALIRIYAENYGSMSDQKVSEIGNKALDLEAKRTDLKKRYFDRMSQSVSPKVAGRFLQIEHQLLLILDLQVSAMLPIVE
jgi:hypothetical protein